MPEIEDDLKLQNWLSVLTFDVYKYARAGGAVMVEWTDGGLTVHLYGIAPDTPGVNSKLQQVTEIKIVTGTGGTRAAPQEEPTP